MPPDTHVYYLAAVVSVWEIAPHKAENNFVLTCVGVKECVGGFWQVQNTTDREEQLDICDQIMLKEDLF